MTRDECWSRFLYAVREARRNNPLPADALVRSLRRHCGNAVAERQRAELWNYIRSKAKA